MRSTDSRGGERARRVGTALELEAEDFFTGRSFGERMGENFEREDFDERSFGATSTGGRTGEILIFGGEEILNFGDERGTRRTGDNS